MTELNITASKLMQAGHIHLKPPELLTVLSILAAAEGHAPVTDLQATIPLHHACAVWAFDSVINRCKAPISILPMIVRVLLRHMTDYALWLSNTPAGTVPVVVPHFITLADRRLLTVDHMPTSVDVLTCEHVQKPPVPFEATSYNLSIPVIKHWMTYVAFHTD